MAVYSSVFVQGTEFIPLDGSPLPGCLNATWEPPPIPTVIMRPAVLTKEGEWNNVLAAFSPLKKSIRQLLNSSCCVVSPSCECFNIYFKMVYPWSVEAAK